MSVAGLATVFEPISTNHLIGANYLINQVSMMTFIAIIMAFLLTVVCHLVISDKLDFIFSQIEGIQHTLEILANRTKC